MFCLKYVILLCSVSSSYPSTSFPVLLYFMVRNISETKSEQAQKKEENRKKTIRVNKKQ